MTSRVRAAANLAQSRYYGPRVRAATEDEQKEARLAAAKLATVHGWCMACGVTVNEAAGVKHDRWCPDVPPERRAPR